MTTTRFICASVSTSTRPAIDSERRRIVHGIAGGLGMALLGGTGLMYGEAVLAAARVGQPAPHFSAVDTQGVSYDLAGLKGKLVVLEWTNADCPFVGKHYKSSNMQTLQKEVTEAGAVWLSIISSAPGEQGHVTPEQANQLSADRGAAPSGVILDPEGTIGRAYQAQTTPHMYVIDTEGVLRYMGGIDSIPSTRIEDIDKAQPYFREAFLAVSQGTPVAQAATRPYGCAIKYAS